MTDEMPCKACGKTLVLKAPIKAQGWVECPKCHAIFSLPMQNIDAASNGFDSETSEVSPESKFENKQSAQKRQEGFFSKLAKAFSPQSRPDGMRPVIDMPKGMELIPGDAFCIRRRWFSGITIFMIVFLVFWFAFLGVFISSAFLEGGAFPFFITGHLLAGLALLVKVVWDFINHTDYLLKDGMLELAHAPLPWPGNKKIPAAELKQIFVKKHVSHSSNGSSSTSYSLNYLDGQAKSKKIVGGFYKAEQALFLEQEFEKALGIHDSYVPGQYS